MKAGYIVGKVIQKKLKSWSQKSVINWLASKIGTAAAKKIVSKAVKVGASALATYLAAHVSWLAPSAVSQQAQSDGSNIAVCH